MPGSIPVRKKYPLNAPVTLVHVPVKVAVDLITTPVAVNPAQSGV